MTTTVERTIVWAYLQGMTPEDAQATKDLIYSQVAADDVARVLTQNCYPVGASTIKKLRKLARYGETL